MMLTSYENLTSDKILFHEAKEYKVKDSKFKHQHIKIETKYPNGKTGELVIETPFLFSFGANEKKSQETDKLIGFSIPVCLWEKDGQPNLEEKAFFEAINKITEICQQHLEEEFGPDMELTLKTPFYYKQVEYVDKRGKKRTKKDESAAPLLSAKLIYSEKSKKILSPFTKKGKEKVNPFDFLEQYCRVTMALIIEGIFMSKTATSLQIKVSEVFIKPLKPREVLLSIKESDDEGEESDILDIEED